MCVCVHLYVYVSKWLSPPSYDPTPLPSPHTFTLQANNVRSFLQYLDNQTSACRSVDALQKLRHTLTGVCNGFSNGLYNTLTLITCGRKRPVSTKDTPTSKRRGQGEEGGRREREKGNRIQ